MYLILCINEPKLSASDLEVTEEKKCNGDTVVVANDCNRLFIILFAKNVEYYENKSAQSNLGRGPRHGGVAHGAGLWPACVAETRWASVNWRSFVNMAKLNWLS